MLSDGNESDSSDESFSKKSRTFQNGNSAAKRKRTKRKSTKAKSGTDRFMLHSAMREDHKKPIYSVTFNPFLTSHLSPVFATVGGRQLTIYECNQDSTKILQVFQDPNETECFYTSAWGILGENPVIAFAGEHGSIRILSVINNQIVRHLIGHGSSINELHFHPIRRRILASASKDHTIRIWDVWSEVITFILGGLNGHRDEVLSCDFRPDGEFVASCGMDHSILIWNIASERAQLAIEAAEVFKLHNSDSPFPTVTLPPIFSTRDVHSNYIDCVRWFGDFILSKSCENEIKCWEPDLEKPGEFPSPPIQAMVSFEVLNCPNWYVRFGCDRFQKYMAVGNQVGKIFVWDMITEHSSKPYLTLSHAKMTAQCRQCSFSPSGHQLVAVFDDATVWRFDFQGSGEGKRAKVVSSRESSLSSNATTPCSSQPMTPVSNGFPTSIPLVNGNAKASDPVPATGGAAEQNVPTENGNDELPSLPELEPMETNGHA